MSYNNPATPTEGGDSRQSRVAHDVAHALGTTPQGEGSELVLWGDVDPSLYREQDQDSEEGEEDEYEDEEIDPYWSTAKICVWILQTDPRGVEVPYVIRSDIWIFLCFSAAARVFGGALRLRTKY